MALQGRATDTAAFGGGNPVGEGVKNIRDTEQQARHCRHPMHASQS
jgi:hypothetical protein